MNSVSARLPYYLSKGYLKRDILDIFSPRFWQSVSSKIYELSGSLSEDPARSNMVKTPKHCSNLKDSTLLTQFSWKKSPLVRYKILGVFVNTLTADCKYSLLNRDDLLQHLQLQLSEKQKNYFPLFLYILEI